MTEPTPLLAAVLSLKDQVGDLKGAMGETRADVRRVLATLDEQSKQIEALKESKWKRSGGLAVIAAVFGLAGNYLGKSLGFH
jgi:hypothetical protein